MFLFLFLFLLFALFLYIYILPRSSFVSLRWFSSPKQKDNNSAQHSILLFSFSPPFLHHSLLFPSYFSLCYFAYFPHFAILLPRLLFSKLMEFSSAALFFIPPSIHTRMYTSVQTYTIHTQQAQNNVHAGVVCALSKQQEYQKLPLSFVSAIHSIRTSFSPYIYYHSTLFLSIRHCLSPETNAHSFYI